MLLSDVVATGVCSEDAPGNVVTTLLPAVNVVPLLFSFGVLPPGVFSGLFPPPGFDGFKLLEEGIPFSDEFKPLHTEGAAEETGMDGT